MTTTRRIDPSLAELRDLFRKALDTLPPAPEGTPPVPDHMLDCYTVAAAYTLAQRLGLEAPALTA